MKLLKILSGGVFYFYALVLLPSCVAFSVVGHEHRVTEDVLKSTSEALSAFVIEKHRYPETLQDLYPHFYQSSHPSSFRNHPVDGWGRKILYDRTHGLLVSVGPDGSPNTHDDIKIKIKENPKF